MLPNSQIKQNLEEIDALASLSPILVTLYLLVVSSVATGLFGFH
ncbi:MAG TPA: hypothetical protein VNW15_14665 [Rhizomicrobium sp.]|jgi:hypothetical protein|nr:hypothetical protein [Rhizomicrobium sp.]